MHIIISRLWPRSSVWEQERQAEPTFQGWGKGWGASSAYQGPFSAWVNQRSRFLDDILQQPLTHEANPALLILLRTGHLKNAWRKETVLAGRWQGDWSRAFLPMALWTLTEDQWYPRQEPVCTGLCERRNCRTLKYVHWGFNSKIGHHDHCHFSRPGAAGKKTSCWKTERVTLLSTEKTWGNRDSPPAWGAVE